MQDASVVRVVDRLSNLREQPHTLLHFPARIIQLRLQIGAIHQLHAEIMPALVLANLVNGDNIRVGEIGCGLGLDVKAPDFLLAGELAVQNHLQGNQPVEALLPGFVNDAHSASGNFTQENVVAEVFDPGAGSQCVWIGALRGGLTRTVGLANPAASLMARLLGWKGEGYGFLG